MPPVYAVELYTEQRVRQEVHATSKNDAQQIVLKMLDDGELDWETDGYTTIHVVGTPGGDDDGDD